MLSLRRLLILLVAASGAVAAAVSVGGGPPSVREALDAEQAPAEAPATAPTDAEVADELRRAEEALGGKAKASEELPVRPLRADLPIALPSDI